MNEKQSGQLLAEMKRTALTTSGALSPRASQLQQLIKSGSSEVSVFNGPPATLAQIDTATTQLAIAFPQMSPTFWGLLGKRIAEKGITADRLSYAVNQVIDNFTYQRLTIADILGEKTDRKFRVLTYGQMLAECSKVGCSTEDYAPIKIGDTDRPFWVLASEKALYQIPDQL